MQILHPWEERELHPLEHTANQLWNKLRGSQSDSYDIFFELINSVVWQSPKELALRWIEKVARDEWAMFSDNSAENIEVRQMKESIRRRVLTMTWQFLFTLVNQPNIFQRVTTRLLVNKTLTTDLPIHDQDRVLAAEFMTKYSHWKSFVSIMSQKSFVSIMSQNPFESEGQVLANEPIFLLGENGETECQLTYNWHIGPLKPFPELPIIHETPIVGVNLGWIILWSQVAVSKVILPPELLRRYGDSINPSEKESLFRKSILTRTGNVPTYRKRSFWNKLSGEEPEWVLQANPV